MLKYVLFEYILCSKQVIDYRKVRSKNLKFSTDLQDQVMDGWSVTLQLIIQISRLPIEYLNLKSKLYGIQTLLFICNRFGCKLWLQFQSSFSIIPEIDSKLFGCAL